MTKPRLNYIKLINPTLPSIRTYEIPANPSFCRTSLDMEEEYKLSMCALQSTEMTQRSRLTSLAKSRARTP